MKAADYFNETLNLKSGMPQGLVPGLLFFIHFVNHIKTVTLNFTVYIYTDDTELVVPG